MGKPTEIRAVLQGKELPQNRFEFTLFVLRSDETWKTYKGPWVKRKDTLLRKKNIPVTTSWVWWGPNIYTSY